MSQATKRSTESVRSRLGRLGRVVAVAGSAVALTVGLTGSAHAAVLTPLNESTTSFQKTFQPVFDYDSDSCFPAAARIRSSFAIRS